MGVARIFDLGLIAQGWQERGFSCALWTEPTGQVWADFTHDSEPTMRNLGNTTSGWLFAYLWTGGT